VTKEVYEYTWQKLEESVDMLARWYEEEEHLFDFIYGVSRGGLIPAVMLSHRLEIPLTIDMPEGNTLVVDDIYETGKTLDKFLEAGLKCAVLVHKRIKPRPANLTITMAVMESTWVEFAWESQLTPNSDEVSRSLYGNYHSLIQI